MRNRTIEDTLYDKNEKPLSFHMVRISELSAAVRAARVPLRLAAPSKARAFWKKKLWQTSITPRTSSAAFRGGVMLRRLRRRSRRKQIQTWSCYVPFADVLTRNRGSFRVCTLFAPDACWGCGLRMLSSGHHGILIIFQKVCWFNVSCFSIFLYQ